jgi:hypothetical protein
VFNDETFWFHCFAPEIVLPVCSPLRENDSRH